MIKIDLCKYCLECDFPDLKVSEKILKVNSEPAMIVQTVSCHHAKVCSKYMNTPLQALPIEALFKD